MVIFSCSLRVTSGVTSQAKLCFLPVNKKIYKTSIICFYCVNYVICLSTAIQQNI